MRTPRTVHQRGPFRTSEKARTLGGTEHVRTEGRSRSGRCLRTQHPDLDPIGPHLSGGPNRTDSRTSRDLAPDPCEPADVRGLAHGSGPNTKRTDPASVPGPQTGRFRSHPTQAPPRQVPQSVPESTLGLFSAAKNQSTTVTTFIAELATIGCMSARAIVKLGKVAEDQWGMVTSSQAQEVGVSLHALSRMANSGAVERVAHGVYRIAGAPVAEMLGDLRAAYLSLGGHRTTDGRQRRIVVGGETAAGLHGVGNFYLSKYDFITPHRRGTRLRKVRLRVRNLDPGSVTFIDGMATLTAERLVADLVSIDTDLSMVSDVIAEAHSKGLFHSPTKLDSYLEPLARRTHHHSGAELRSALFAGAGL